MDPELWPPLGIALGLGLLVGLQREWAKAGGAGIRTFPLLTLLGTLCGVLARLHGGWILGAGLLAVTGLLIVMQLARRAQDDEPHPGQTTEAAALVMFATGALLAQGETMAATAIAGTVAVLLQWKRPLHQFVHRVGQDEMRAVFRLVLIALVVLPVLPDRAFGPYEVLNPFRIWQMVVLIVGISLAGYMAAKYLGAGTGSLVAGALGGLISSTATTVSYARRSRGSPAASPMAARVVMVASTVVFVRVGLEVAIVAPGLLPRVAPPFVVLTLVMGALALAAHWRTPAVGPDHAPSGSPGELPAAVVFGALYAVVLLLVAVAREHFGARGLFVVAALSGLTDMDAITLSTAQMMQAGRLDVDAGWRMMLVGALSNLVFKGGVVATLGSPDLRRRVFLLFGPSLVAGVLLLVAWPVVT